MASGKEVRQLALGDDANANPDALAVSPDGRLVMGSRGFFGHAPVATAARHHYRAVQEIFPQLQGLRYEYHWGGMVAMTRDHLPHLHELAPGLLAGLGYNGRGVADYVTTKNNVDGMAKLTESLATRTSGLIFANLVDFDMLYGHRKDVEGFARSLEEFDALLALFVPKLETQDLLLITADHGCDPDPVNPTTDHSREYVPIVTYSPDAAGGKNLGVRATLADMGQTIAENFDATILQGDSFLNKIAPSAK